MKHARMTTIAGLMLFASGPSLMGAATLFASRSARAEEVGRLVEVTAERPGSESARRAEHGEPTADLLVGPAATVKLAPLVLCLQGGASAVRAVGRTTWGSVVLAGVGTAF